MRSIVKLRITAAVFLATILGVGCNPLTMAYFTLAGIEDKVQPEFKIARDPKKTTHAVVLASMLQESRSELLGVERQLAGDVCKCVELGCKSNNEKIQLIPVHKVEEFKSNNPGWRTMTAQEIGRKFDVDYVIEVEVSALNLYERDSRKQLFRGRSALTLSVYDVSKSSAEGPTFQKRLSVEYPKARGPIPVDDEMPVERFRDTFVQRIATEISWQLTPHVSTSGMMQD